MLNLKVIFVWGFWLVTTFKDVFEFAQSKEINRILPVVDEQDFKGLDQSQRADKIRGGYYFSVERVRGRVTFRVCFRNKDTLNINFKSSNINQVEIYEYDDFGSSKMSSVYTLPIDAKIKDMLKLPIIRKKSVLVILEYPMAHQRLEEISEW